MQFSGLLPLLRLCDGSFRRAERDETELFLRTPQHQSYPRASRGCEIPARPSRNLALQCLDRRGSGSCDGVPLQVTVCSPNSPAAPVGPTRHRAMMARKFVSNFKTWSAPNRLWSGAPSTFHLALTLYALKDSIS